MPRRRVAVVVQRYGDGIAGGAEWHARSFVEAIAPHHDVTVLTSCAHDAATWAMHYAPGEERVGGVAVRRFAHPPRHEGGRARVPLSAKWRFWAGPLLDALRITRVAQPDGDDERDGHLFLRRQGPTCDGLLPALRDGGFDVAVFFTALYHPTAEALPAWGARSVLVPTLHDEKPMHLPWFHRVFAAAGTTLWNTAAERRLARRLYGASAGEGVLCGAAVAVEPPSAEVIAAARARHRLPARTLVYVGRIEKGKGCAELLAAWQALGDRVGDAALVFVGRGALEIPDAERVRCTGFLGPAERDALIAGAHALVMPSRLESLSLVTLEAMALGVPVLVNGRCEVLVEQVQDSGAGHAYRGLRALRQGLLDALARPADERARLGERGRRFIAERYAPGRVHAKWLAAVEQACAVPVKPAR